VMEMTDAPLVQLFHNPRGKSSSGGGQGHRTEDVALALVHFIGLACTCPPRSPWLRQCSQSCGRSRS
jgi:hypothetical protein